MGSVFAADLNITSVTYDNSDTFLLINSYDIDNYTFSQTPKLTVIPEENTAYFDINPATLSCPPQDIVVSSGDISEVIVKQISTEPNIVRVTVKYKEGFNPKNIQLKRSANTLIVRFKTTQLQNYYFQHVYSDGVANVPERLERLIIQTPVLATQSVVNQINSAFKLGSATDDKNYVLAKKDLKLSSSYYLDDVTIKNGRIYINGMGSYTLTKPFALSDPVRVVYDIPNAILNSALHNKEIYISQNESVKVAQFDARTVRIVITAESIDKYVPVFASDNQNLAFQVKDSYDLSYKYPRSVLTSVHDEINDSNTHSVKLVFSKPVEYSLVRTQKSYDILLHNVEKAQEINLKSSMLFDGSKFFSLKNGGIVLSIPAVSDDVIDTHAGADGKTLRIKIKSTTVNLPAVKEDEKPVISLPKVDKKGKVYVVIDPGHGGSDCGATRNGIYEKNITLDVSKRVEKLLKAKKGYEVFMTRTSDETVSLEDRVEFSENLQPDIFVSIHVNSSNSSTPKGLETHYYKENSLMLAKTVHASLLNNVNAVDRGLFKSKFYVINHTTAPAILVEIGFISNDSERAQIMTESRKQATAKAIAEGIHDYFKK